MPLGAPPLPALCDLLDQGLTGNFPGGAAVISWGALQYFPGGRCSNYPGGAAVIFRVPCAERGSALVAGSVDGSSSKAWCQCRPDLMAALVCGPGAASRGCAAPVSIRVSVPGRPPLPWREEWNLNRPGEMGSGE